MCARVLRARVFWQGHLEQKRQLIAASCAHEELGGRAANGVPHRHAAGDRIRSRDLRCDAAPREHAHAQKVCVARCRERGRRHSHGRVRRTCPGAPPGQACARSAQEAPQHQLAPDAAHRRGSPHPGSPAAGPWRRLALHVRAASPTRKSVARALGWPSLSLLRKRF